jgi:iron-sulfur cluster assembly protein
MNNDMIISLTPKAISHIKHNMNKLNAIGFRLAVKKTGCSGFAYVPDMVNEARPEDICFSQDGLTIFVDKHSVNYLQGTCVDYVDQGLGQTKLLFHNPNAANLCGCGESFNLADDTTDHE